MRSGHAVVVPRTHTPMQRAVRRPVPSPIGYAAHVESYPPPTPLPPTSRSPIPAKPTLRSVKTQAQLAEIVEVLRRVGEKCAYGCPACRDIAGLPEREGGPVLPSKRQPRQHEDPAEHRRNCPAIETWSLLARLIA